MIKRVLLAAAAVAVATASFVPEAESNQTVYGCILGTLGPCSSSPANGIKNQIMKELNSMGYSFVNVNTQWIHCTAPCQLQSVAHNALVNAAKSKNDYITLNSAWRSSAEQYLLYKWYLAGQCGIQLAAKPGQSNHEGGLAIDTSYYNYWMSALQNNGWRWLGSKDVVHFDYVNGGSDLKAQNLKAFQRLWNRHNSKKIAEDGIYGPDTANALYNTPCGGW